MEKVGEETLHQKGHFQLWKGRISGQDEHNEWLQEGKALYRDRE